MFLLLSLFAHQSALIPPFARSLLSVQLFINLLQSYSRGHVLDTSDMPELPVWKVSDDLKQAYQPPRTCALMCFALSDHWAYTSEVWRRRVVRERRACFKRTNALSRLTTPIWWTRPSASEYYACTHCRVWPVSSPCLSTVVLLIPMPVQCYPSASQQQKTEPAVVLLSQPHNRSTPFSVCEVPNFLREQKKIH